MTLSFLADRQTPMQKPYYSHPFNGHAVFNNGGEEYFSIYMDRDENKEVIEYSYRVGSMRFKKTVKRSILDGDEDFLLVDAVSLHWFSYSRPKKYILFCEDLDLMHFNLTNKSSDFMIRDVCLVNFTRNRNKFQEIFHEEKMPFLLFEARRLRDVWIEKNKFKIRIREIYNVFKSLFVSRKIFS